MHLKAKISLRAEAPRPGSFLVAFTKAANRSPKGGILKTLWLLGLYVGDNCYLCGGKE